jgi:hypothetical protein
MLIQGQDLSSIHFRTHQCDSQDTDGPTVSDRLQSHLIRTIGDYVVETNSPDKVRSERGLVISVDPSADNSELEVPKEA